MARKLQNRLALAQFKTDRGWEDLPLASIEPKVEEELRRKRPTSSGDILSDSSSSSNASEFHYSSRALMSSPLKSSTFFSDQIGSGGSTGHRKRTYHNSFDQPSSSSGSSHKRFRSSPSGAIDGSSHSSWRTPRRLAQSSPIKPRKHTHFTTSTGPELSFYRGSTLMNDDIGNFTSTSDDDEDTLPAHSFNIHSSPPRTPPPARNRGSLRRNKDKGGKSGEEGADLLLYLATSPSPANPTNRARMQPPSTPPPKNMALPSSMMTTPGGRGDGLLSVFGGPQTPGQNFDFADFVNITPSPGQRTWKTPNVKTPGVRTPATITRRGLTFESFLPPPVVSPRKGLGMDLGGDLNSR